MTNLLGCQLHLASRDQSLGAIEAAVNKTGPPVQLATVNAEFLTGAKHNPAFKLALEQMTHCSIDGSGPWFYLKLFYPKLAAQLDRYPGASLVQELFERYQSQPVRFYLVGGNPKHTSQIRATLKQRYPQLQLVGFEYGGQINAKGTPEDTQLADRIEAAKPDILLVGFGAPKQELFIHQLALPLPVMIGVGGSFDFFGQKPRAPKLWQSIGLEWAYRALHEPGHLIRAIKAVSQFLWLIIQYHLTRPPRHLES